MIPNELKKIIDYVIEYASESSNDWFLIKRELINLFPPKERKRFSRRHYSTKKHILNDFDKAVIEYWEQKTGQKIFINKDKLHPPDWKRRPKGWRLVEINEERRKRKAAKTN